jgi:site-specific DNA recombinase
MEPRARNPTQGGAAPTSISGDWCYTGAVSGRTHEYGIVCACGNRWRLQADEEPDIVDELDRWLSSLFDAEHLDETCEQLAAASAAPDDNETARREIAQRKVADCDRRLSRYRAALESGADPAVVAAWIAEAQGEKLAAQEVLDRSVRQPSTPAEIRDLVAGLTDFTQALRGASGDAKAEVYTSLGLRLTYHPNQRQVDVIAAPKAVDVRACRRGDLNPHALSGTRPST